VANPSFPDPPEGAEPAPPPIEPPKGPGRTARARAQAEHLKSRADDTVKQLEAKRPSSRSVDAIFATMERDVSHGGGVLAAAVAFRIFIFLVPFVFVIVTAFPFASDAADQNPADLADKFGMAGLASTAIRSADDLSTWHRLALVCIGLFALVLASRSLVRVLRITHGLAWNARVPKLRKATRAGIALILVVLVFAIFGFVTASIDVGVVGLVPTLIEGAFVVAMWLLVQNLLPHHPAVTWKDQLPGAILVGIGTEALQLATVVYFSRSIESKSSTYGAIGAAVAILLWAYVLGRIIVSGAMLNAVLWDQKQAEHPRAPARQARTAPASAPAGPEEHHDPGREHPDDHRLEVERDVGVVREEQQDDRAQ
jgi:uncharacterized BrkB/YihY/UPF0761 family membrane protein